MKIFSGTHIPTISKIATISTMLGLARLGCSQTIVDNNFTYNDNIKHFLWNKYENFGANTITYPYLPKEINKNTLSKNKRITPSGILAQEGIEFPSNEIIIAGKVKKASIVVDLETNILYLYDTNGSPYKAYLIASGKKSTPTIRGVRKIRHFENYPYKSAPSSSKRRQNPKDYGPKIIYLETINTTTGENMGSNGQFIHGNNKISSLGKHSSKGCIRMDNEAILEVADFVKKQDYVLIK